MKYSGKVGKWPMKKLLNFGGDPDHHLNTLLFSRFFTIGRFGAMLQWWACTSRHCHSNYDVITSLALGGGMH